MRLLKHGANFHVLETHAGAVLLSYENPAALRLGSVYYQRRAAISRATWAHLVRFVPADMTAVIVPPEQFAVYLSEILSSSEV